jgi:histidine triad (HIT) family protein
MPDTIFHKIVRDEMDAYIVWQDDKYLAFLTPFPNTPGVTVVIPKQDTGDYIFALGSEEFIGLMKAVQTVAKLLERAFETSRIALVFEGTGVAYVHAKLYPLHGGLADETNIWSAHTEFYPLYTGYITTVEGPKMDDIDLKSVQQKILNAGM